jgi:hypothetical protein
MRTALIALGVGTIVTGLGCQPGQDASFPSYVEAAQQTTPVVRAAAPTAGAHSLHFLDLGYSTGWGSPSDRGGASGRLLEILGDPNTGTPVPVTDVYELIRELDGIASHLGRHFDKDTNETHECDPIAADKIIKVPFYDASGAATFFDFPVAAGDFLCSIRQQQNLVVFGRKPLASPPAGCTDPYAYNVISAQYFLGSLSADDTGRSPFRGTHQAVTSMIRSSFTPCTGDLKVAYAQGGGYDGGALFSSRSEIIGNRETHDFRIRVLIWGREDPARGTDKIRIRGAGRSRGAGNSFVLSAEDAQSKNIYCLSPEDAPGQFRDGSCGADLESVYSSIADYSYGEAELPVYADPQTSLNPLFATDLSAFGL